MNDINDINPPIEIFFNYTPFIIAFIIVLIIIFTLLYLTFRVLKQNKEKPETHFTSLSNTPEEKALKILNLIKKENLIEDNKVELFYFKISRLVKDYFFEKTNNNIDSLTTKEVILLLENLQLFSLDFLEKTKSYLIDLEYIKFTPKNNAQDKMNTSINNLIEILETQRR